MKAVQREARAQGLDLELVLLQDYSEPNGKLAQGELDAAAFQTQAYLEAECRDRGFAFGVLSRTVLFPVGIYAREPGISLADIPAGAVVQLPGDAVNGSRALRLLEQAGLLRLRPGTGEYASLSDIAENPKALQLVQREGTELPAHFSEADLTVMGTTLAGALELVPCRDALALESADSPYAQVLAVRQTDLDRPEFQQLRSICQSEAMVTPGAVGLDCTKLTVQVRKLGLSGIEAEYILRHEVRKRTDHSGIRCRLYSGQGTFARAGGFLYGP